MATPLPYRHIGIIGTGRVARALALGLAHHCATPPLIWGRSPDSARAALAQIGTAERATHLSDLASYCDVIAIAVTDDALHTVIADLANAAGFTHAPLVFHVSGASGAASLAPLAVRGATTAAIHPAMTFTGDATAEVRRMVGARFAITGSSEDASKQAESLVRVLGGVPVAMAEHHRALYHAALCHGANHLVTLLAGSADILRAAGVDDPMKLLAPLVRAALENTLARGFAALSGPLLRGDATTIGNHLTALDRDCPDLAPDYRAMALATVQALRREGPSQGSAGLDGDGDDQVP